jgi:protein phosphatase 1G
MALSTDFKPNVPSERIRIENAGRTVTVTEARGNIPRIDEGIAISRSLGIVLILPTFLGLLWEYTIECIVITALLHYISGDMTYKDIEGLSPLQQPMTALPEVRTVSVTNLCQ